MEHRERHRNKGMTPEEIVQHIIEKIEEGDPEVLNRISLVMKNRLLSKKEDLQQIEALFTSEVTKRSLGN